MQARPVLAYMLSLKVMAGSDGRAKATEKEMTNWDAVPVFGPREVGEWIIRPSTYGLITDGSGTASANR